METCQNQLAARFALPEAPMPVRDRRITLQIQCTETAAYSSDLTSIGTGKARTGGTTQQFFLCENHSTLFRQIDRELHEDGWAPAYQADPVRL